MTLEELVEYEDSKKAANPYFRRKINNWRQYALYLLNDDVKELDPNSLLTLQNNVSEYIRIILLPDTDIVKRLEKNLLKISNLFEIKTDGVTMLQATEEN